MPGGFDRYFNHLILFTKLPTTSLIPPVWVIADPQFRRFPALKANLLPASATDNSLASSGPSVASSRDGSKNKGDELHQCLDPVSGARADVDVIEDESPLSKEEDDLENKTHRMATSTKGEAQLHATVCASNQQSTGALSIPIRPRFGNKRALDLLSTCEEISQAPPETKRVRICDSKSESSFSAVSRDCRGFLLGSSRPPSPQDLQTSKASPRFISDLQLDSDHLSLVAPLEDISDFPTGLAFDSVSPRDNLPDFLESITASTFDAHFFSHLRADIDNSDPQTVSTTLDYATTDGTTQPGPLTGLGNDMHQLEASSGAVTSNRPESPVQPADMEQCEPLSPSLSSCESTGSWPGSPSLFEAVLLDISVDECQKAVDECGGNNFSDDDGDEGDIDYRDREEYQNHLYWRTVL